MLVRHENEKLYFGVGQNFFSTLFLRIFDVKATLTTQSTTLYDDTFHIRISRRLHEISFSSALQNEEMFVGFFFACSCAHHIFPFFIKMKSFLFFLLLVHVVIVSISNLMYPPTLATLFHSSTEENCVYVHKIRGEHSTAEHSQDDMSLISSLIDARTNKKEKRFFFFLILHLSCAVLVGWSNESIHHLVSSSIFPHSEASCSIKKFLCVAETTASKRE